MLVACPLTYVLASVLIARGWLDVIERNRPWQHDARVGEDILGRPGGRHPVLLRLGLRAIGGEEPAPARAAGAARGVDAGGARPAHAAVSRFAEVAAGWRFILGDTELRPLFLNTVLVNALIMATAPLTAKAVLPPLKLIHADIRPPECRSRARHL